MNTADDDRQKGDEPTEIEKATPGNPSDVPGKEDHPDPDRTEPGTISTSVEEASESLEESTFTSEHDISREHSEPTNVTGTTNDNAIDGEYIDVGGGD